MTSCGKSVVNFGFTTFLDCRTIVDCDKQPWPVHCFAPTFFQQTCYDHLDWTVDIFLLVRQELERIDQIVTHSLRRSVCPKYCGISVVRAVWFDHASVRSPQIALASSSRTPPVSLRLSMPRRDPLDAVFKREKVTMRTHVRQCDSSHSVTRYDNPPQEVCVLT